MKSTLTKTTRLQCPECRMELLPGDYSMEEQHVTCGRCGREIFAKISQYKKMECPQCEEAVKEKGEVNLAECCCP